MTKNYTQYIKYIVNHRKVPGGKKYIANINYIFLMISSRENYYQTNNMSKFIHIYTHMLHTYTYIHTTYRELIAEGTRSNRATRKYHQAVPS